MNHFNTITSYFAGFAAKNIEKISEKFSPLIELSDWVGAWKGKEEVKAAIEINLKMDIVIVLEKLYFSHDEDETVATCMIDIYIDKELHKVVDLITLSKTTGLITTINAYKR